MRWPAVVQDAGCRPLTLRKRERRPWHNPFPQVVQEGYSPRMSCCGMRRRLGGHDRATPRPGGSPAQRLECQSAHAVAHPVGGVLHAEIRCSWKPTSRCFQGRKASELRGHLHFQNTPRLASSLAGWDESLQRVEGHAGHIQELPGAGLHVGAPYTGHLWCFLSVEVPYAINRDILKALSLGGASRRGASAGRVRRRYGTAAVVQHSDRGPVDWHDGTGGSPAT